MKSIDYINNYLKENLSDERYNHSIGTAESAKKLAIKYALDSDKAYLAGLVHDCAKNKDDKNHPKTYHAEAGAILLQKEFEIYDPEIIQAVKLHTTGSVDMTLFDKIIYIADKIELNTRPDSYAGEMREVIEKDDSTENLDMAIFISYKKTIQSLVERKLYICSTTIDAYNDLVNKLNTNQH